MVLKQALGEVNTTVTTVVASGEGEEVHQGGLNGASNDLLVIIPFLHCSNECADVHFCPFFYALLISYKDSSLCVNI